MQNSLQGLTANEAKLALEQYGRNSPSEAPTSALKPLLVDVVTEPMFILLAVACGLYVLLGQWQEGIVLGVAMMLVAAISVFQSLRSDRALQALRQLTQPTTSVLRDSRLISVPVEEVVVGDLVWISEGQTVPADGQFVQGNDCAVDESILTGESAPVFKASPQDRFYAGTTLVAGSAYCRVQAVGVATELGKLGRSLQTIELEKTPLQQQISQFVGRMAVIGVVAFGFVWGINFVRSGDWATSLLLGLTIAMSVLPEEIPVAFSSFMALGAARMVRFGVLTKQPHTVESLGSATVICADKTGTITQEGMRLACLYDQAAQTIVWLDTPLSTTAQDVLSCARWASELAPFDPMEQAIVAGHQQHVSAERSRFQRVIEQEYPLSGTPPMMTHGYAAAGNLARVVGKGAVERILRVCQLPEAEAIAVRQQADQLARQGYRVLGIAASDWNGTTYPAEQDDFHWLFKGLVALENPPKANAKAVVQQFVTAGIKVKMITGDSPETAGAIARQVALPDADLVLTGPEVMALTDSQLHQQSNQVNVFARMFPEAKLRVVRALKAGGEVVAMTGDGVNDGPALKAAHIGVAMGKRGTELAKQAASLVLVHDDLSSMVSAIAQGRRIYQNFKKAVGYIVSIHIPIILTVAVPLMLDWRYVNLFSPVHVIFLELVMGPTCSIAFENEPAETNLMQQPPRPLTNTLFRRDELGRSLVQGLTISLATLTMYAQSMQAGAAIEVVRTVTFSTLVLSNIALTLVSRSDRDSVFASLHRPNPLLWLMIALTLLLLAVSLLVPSVRTFAQFAAISGSQLLACMLAALLGVGWIEVYKSWKRRRASSGPQYR